MDPLTLLHGNCLELLAQLPDESVQCIMTSPPYWGLRCYGVPPTYWPAGTYSPMPGVPPMDFPEWTGCLGLEPCPLMFMLHLVQIFREARRVLRKDGVAWVNMGDSMAGSWGGVSKSEYSPGPIQRNNPGSLSLKTAPPGSKARRLGLKPKDILAIPWRTGLALQADGWHLRQDVIWSKPNPMPESATDRCTKSHEYVLQLTKHSRYFFNAPAIYEPVSPNTHARMAQNVAAQAGSTRSNGGSDRAFKAGGRSGAQWSEEDNSQSVLLEVPAGEYVRPGTMRKSDRVPTGWDTSTGNHHGIEGRYSHSPTGVGWGYGSEETKKPRVKNNASMDAALAQEVQERNKRSVWTIPTQGWSGSHTATYPEKLVTTCLLAATRPGDVVLDFFGGSGTTGRVAIAMGRRCILMELAEEFLPQIEERCTTTIGLAL